MIKIFRLILLCIMALCISLNAQKTKFNIAFCGDVMLDRGVRNGIKAKGDDFLFEKIKDLLAGYKYITVNLECPITHKTDFNEKTWVFKADSTVLPILTQAGVTHTIIPNNHSMDYKAAGLEDTYKYLLKYGLVPVGLAKTKKEACKPAIIKNGTETIAIFASCSMYQGTFSKNAAICNLSAEQMVPLIKEYREENPTHLIFISLHWGVELERTPTTGQKLSARKLIDAGADAIIGHHPHCIQQIEIYKGKPIFYSLGNFIFGAIRPALDFGLIAGFEKNEKNELQVILHPYRISLIRPVPLDKKQADKLKKEIVELSPSVLLEDKANGWLLKENPNPPKKAAVKPAKKGKDAETQKKNADKDKIKKEMPTAPIKKEGTKNNIDPKNKKTEQTQKGVDQINNSIIKTIPEIKKKQDEGKAELNKK